MDALKEKEIKDRLEEVWMKEAIRVSYIPNGWIEKRVTLGKGIGKNLGMIDVDSMLDTIADFGINLDDLGGMNPDRTTIEGIYRAIESYRMGVRYLRDLKEHMGTFNNFKEWRNN